MVGFTERQGIGLVLIVQAGTNFLLFNTARTSPSVTQMLKNDLSLRFPLKRTSYPLLYGLSST